MSFRVHFGSTSGTASRHLCEVGQGHLSAAWPQGRTADTTTARHVGDGRGDGSPSAVPAFFQEGGSDAIARFVESRSCAAVAARADPSDKEVQRQRALVLKKGALPAQGDALSIKDIIRALRNDPERTDQLKAILMRSDIQNAEKLELASALV